MARGTGVRPCPECKSSSHVRRVARTRWMRLIPWSRRYVCNYCRVAFVQILPLNLRTVTEQDLDLPV